MKELERARWRCRRGLLELDIVLQRFMDCYYTHLDEEGLTQFERLLDLPDNDLWDLITARHAKAEEDFLPVLKLLRKS
jgi:antitoxin CptB